MTAPFVQAAWCIAALACATCAAEASSTASWTERKCDLYRQAVDDALDVTGREGISDRFLSENEAFIEAGCTGRARVCARSAQEIELADMLLVMTMNEGMASTFVPFACED